MRRKHYLLYALTIVSLLTLLFSSAGCGGQKGPDSDAQYDVIIIGGGMGDCRPRRTWPVTALRFCFSNSIIRSGDAPPILRGAILRLKSRSM